MTSAGVSWPVSWSGWPDLNRRPLRPELAAPLGVLAPSQLAMGVGGCLGPWLYGVVAVLLCCMPSGPRPRCRPMTSRSGAGVYLPDLDR